MDIKELRKIIKEEIIKEAREKYSVYNKKTFNIIRNNLTRDAAIKMASKNKDHEYGSAAWVEDNYRKHKKKNESVLIGEVKEYRYVLSVEFITDKKISNSAEDLLNGSYFYEEDFPGVVKKAKLTKYF